jgi:hypothetical protein
MTADKSQPAEHGIEKQSVKPGDKPPAGTPITEQADNVIQQRLKAREALQAFRPTRDTSNSFRIDMGDGSEVKDKRPINQVEIVAAGLAGTAPQAGVGEAGKLAPITPPQETQIALKVHDPFEHLKHGVTDGVRHKVQEDIACSSIELKFQKMVHPDLKDENYPSPEVVKTFHSCVSRTSQSA